MFLHITVNQLCGQSIISCLLICFSIHCTVYNKPNKCKKHRHFIYYLVLQKIKLSFGILKYSVQITKGSDNENSDNRDPTIYIYIYIYIYI